MALVIGDLDAPYDTFGAHANMPAKESLMTHDIRWYDSLSSKYFAGTRGQRAELADILFILCRKMHRANSSFKAI